MPFQTTIIDLNDPNRQVLMPRVRFSPNSTFGQRIQDKRAEKQKVACYVADKWFSEAHCDAFVTDGSSTYYLVLALSGRDTDICTNNLAFSAEIATRSNPDLAGLSLTLLGGKHDFGLDATLGDQAESYARDALSKYNLVIASIRELDPELGPTAPEMASRCFKKIAMQKANLLVIMADWKKLITPPIDNTAKVFNPDQWKELLANDNNEVWVVSAMPEMPDQADESEDATIARALLGIPNTHEFGQNVRASLSNVNVQQRRSLPPEKRYALNVFLLSTTYKVNFVEVHAPEGN